MRAHLRKAQYESAAANGVGNALVVRATFEDHMGGGGGACAYVRFLTNTSHPPPLHDFVTTYGSTPARSASD